MPAAFNPRLPRTTPGAPRVISGKDIILAAVEGSATPTFTEIDINPRLPDSFPSGHLSAQRYDMYEFTSLRFRYFPTSAATDTKGIIFLGWEPNANRQAPPNTTDGVKIINAFEYHTQGPVWSPSIVLNVDPKHLPPPRYCRYLPTSSDLNLYDTGSLVVGADGGPGGTVGYVEVEYSIRFYGYHLEDTLRSQSRAAVATLAVAPGTATTKEVTPTFIEKFGNTLFSFVTGNEWVIPAGKYLINSIMDMYGVGGTHNLYALEQGGTKVLQSEFSSNSNALHTHNLTGMITSDGSTPFKLVMENLGGGTDVLPSTSTNASPILTLTPLN